MHKSLSRCRVSPPCRCVVVCSEHYPGNDPKYSSYRRSEWPLTESLKTTLDRVMPYWNVEMAPQIKGGRNLLVAAHGNSLRALVKSLDNIPEDVIADLNIPTGTPHSTHIHKDRWAQGEGGGHRDQGSCLVRTSRPPKSPP